MKYFARVASTYSTRNKATTAALNYIHQLDGTLLLSGAAREQLLDGLRQEIKKINAEHPRCSDIHYSDTNINDKPSFIQVIIENVACIDIYPVVQEKQ